MPLEIITNPHTSATNFSSALIDQLINWFGRVKFKGICLEQGSVSFLQKI